MLMTTTRTATVMMTSLQRSSGSYIKIRARPGLKSLPLRGGAESPLPRHQKSWGAKPPHPTFSNGFWAGSGGLRRYWLGFRGQIFRGFFDPWTLAGVVDVYPGVSHPPPGTPERCLFIGAKLLGVLGGQESPRIQNKVRSIGAETRTGVRNLFSLCIYIYEFTFVVRGLVGYAVVCSRMHMQQLVF
jgi:hypothetical protein